MPPLTPTAREIFILAVLFILLLVFTANTPSGTATVKDLAGTYYKHSDVSSPGLAPTFESQYTLQSLGNSLSWGLGEAPQTKIIVHVPGELSSLLLFSLSWAVHVLGCQCSSRDHDLELMAAHAFDIVTSVQLLLCRISTHVKFRMDDI